MHSWLMINIGVVFMVLVFVVISGLRLRGRTFPLGILVLQACVSKSLAIAAWWTVFAQALSAFTETWTETRYKLAEPELPTAIERFNSGSGRVLFQRPNRPQKLLGENEWLS